MLEKQKQKHGRCGLNSIVSVQIKIGSGKLTFFERATLSNAQNVLQYVGAPPEANKVKKKETWKGDRPRIEMLDEIALSLIALQRQCAVCNAYSHRLMPLISSAIDWSTCGRRFVLWKPRIA